MIIEIINAMLVSVVISIASIVYCCILMDDGMILRGWKLFLDRNLPMWINKPLGFCETCFAGQLGLWSYPILICWHHMDYSLMGHFTCLVCSIFFTNLIHKLYYI